MAKQIGSSKTGGRKKGTPNMRTLAFGETLEKNGIDLLGEVLREARAQPKREKVGVYLSLLPYQYPKRIPTDTATLSLEDHLNSLRRGDLQKLWKNLNELLGYDKQPMEMSLKQLEEFQTTIDNLVKLKKMSLELGDVDDVTNTIR